MYVAYYDASGVNHIIKQDVRPGRAYGTTGFVHTLAFDGGDIETEKNNNRIIVNYRLGSKTTAPTGTTSIDIYTRVNGDEEWVFDCSTPTSNPVKGDIYTYGGCTYTVKEFTSHNELVCSRNENGPQYNNITRNSGTLTRTYGVGDASLTFSNVDNFVFLTSITDTTKRKAKIPFTRAWYDLEIRAVLNSTQKSITPELYSIKTLFDFIDPNNG